MPPGDFDPEQLFLFSQRRQLLSEGDMDLTAFSESASVSTLAAVPGNRGRTDGHRS